MFNHEQWAKGWAYFQGLFLYIVRMRAIRGYAIPVTRAPPPLALENSLIDTENKTHQEKKKTKNKGPGSLTDTENKTHKKKF